MSRPFILPSLLALLLVPFAISAQETPFDPDAKGGNQPLGPGTFCGIEETNFADPDWIMMTSDRIVRSADCVAECQTCQECWYDLAPGAPCYPENRYWKFSDPDDEVASIFPMGALSVGTFDGMYVKPGIEVQFYQGPDEQNPFGPMQMGPLYASIDFWIAGACEGFEPGTFFVTGGAGALASYSVTLNGGCRGRVLWEDDKPIEGASVVAYALTNSGSEIVAQPVGPPEITDADGFFDLPGGMSTDNFPPIPGEIGISRGVKATITYTEDSGVQVTRTITNYPRWDPLLPLTRQQTGREEIFFPFPVIFQPGVSGTYNSGSADGLRNFLTADPGFPGPLTSQLFRIKQGRGYDRGIPAFPFFGMPSRDVFGPYGNDGISWGYDNSAIQTANSVADSARRLQAHLLARVLPEMQQFTPDFDTINMSGHSLGGIISRRWVNRYYATPRRNKYVTFDAVHGGTRLIANNFIPNLLNEFAMNGFLPFFGSRVLGWNDFNWIPNFTTTLLFASVDEGIVISPSVSAFGVGRILEQQLFSFGGFGHSGTCLRSVGGWELAVPNRGHSIQNDPEVVVSAGRFLAGYPPTLGTQGSPGGSGTAGTPSGPAANLCPAPLGPGSVNASEFFELSALAGNTAVAVLTPGLAATVTVEATLVGPALLTVHDGGGVELPIMNLVSSDIGPDTVAVVFEVDLPAASPELRLTAGAGEVLGYVVVSYPAGVEASLTTDAGLYGMGDTVILNAALTDGMGTILVGLSGAAEATVTLPDASTLLVTLFDDGTHDDGAAADGVYGNTFTDTTQGGTYGFIGAISADIGGITYRRMAGGSFGVTPDGASFTGVITETLVDDDMNGLAEAIRLELMIDAVENGEYRVQADLVDDSATVVGQLNGTAEVTTAPTMAVVALDIEALLLYQVGSGGPYTVESIVLVDVDEALVMDTRADHITQSYVLGDFEAPLAPVLSRCFPADDFIGGGGEILLFGENLQDATGVFVGFAAVPQYTVVGDTSILFTAPPGPEGPTTVRVITPWGDTTQQGIFRYVANNGPIILSPPSVEVDCLANSVTFTVDASGTPPLTYQWRKDELDIPGADQSVYVIADFQAGDNGIYDVLVSNSFGTTVSPDVVLEDCNSSGVLDACDIELGTSEDCDGNGTPDECDIAAGADDCNMNGIIDACDITSGFSLDCNSNGIPDECDITSGFSLDCNSNGIPDECDIASGFSLDCNSNGVPDDCDLVAGTSPDCNSNGIPDECDIASGFSLDCNSNGVPDDCDLVAGTSPDCNSNGIPDECDIASGFSLDCNSNGVPDDCDLVAGTSEDCNSNGVPDECDIASGSSTDTNGDGIPDECAEFLRGDANVNGGIALDDGIFVLIYLTGGPIICFDAADFDDDGTVNIVDPIALFSFLFQGGAPPPAPAGICGPDPTLDPLDCFGPVPVCP